MVEQLIEAPAEVARIDADCRGAVLMIRDRYRDAVAVVNERAAAWSAAIEARLRHDR